jgi:hypothetical protein
MAIAFIGEPGIEKPLPWRDRITRYQTCVRAKAEVFERAEEPIKQTVDAAFGACSVERAGVLELVFQVQSSRPAMTIAQREAGQAAAFVDIEQPLREDLTTSLFEKRAARK